MYINKFNSPKSYDIDTIPDLPMKKLRQKEVKEFVQGQAANNCPKKKKSVMINTTHPTTTNHPLTTDKHSTERGTMHHNL